MTTKRRLRVVSRAAMIRLALLAVCFIAGGAFSWWWMVDVPGESFAGPRPALDDDAIECVDRLAADLDHLAIEIGPRNVYRPEAYRAAAEWIRERLETLGYEVELQKFMTETDPLQTHECVNIITERAGSTTADEIVVIGAHYDTFGDSPGANDNGTGVVSVLELARRFVDASPERTIRFVLFANEEPPFFWTDDMGSLVYAKRCAARDENIVGMISVETIGYYSDAPDSQDYPAPLDRAYPSTGDFVGFVSNVRSRTFLHEVIGTFRDAATVPSEGGALFGGLPGVGWSDHWAFWSAGYDGVMVTDTATFRYPWYHTTGDTPDKLDFDRMVRVVDGLATVIGRVARIP